jgi:hypothetical protein
MAKTSAAKKPQMSDREIAIRQRLKDDFIHYASRCLKVRPKESMDAEGKPLGLVPFELNRAQMHIHQLLQKQKGETGKVRAICLKGRQQGCSTYVGGRLYHLTTHSHGLQTFILTHALDATQNLFKMAQRYYEHTPDLVKPSITISNSKELIFGALDSGYKVGTAENKGVGRSSTIQAFHGSEVAFWSNAAEHAAGIMQAVPDAKGTEIILESTANGVGNYFHQMWQKAEAGDSDFIAIFVPWFWQEEYTRDVPAGFNPTEDERALIDHYGLTHGQLVWRRKKVVDLSINGVNGERLFKQEYPNNSTEAFQLTGEDTYIQSDMVMRARRSHAERYGKLVLGVDPARFGDDRTAIIRRQGRQAYGLETYIKKDTMEITGIVHSIYNAEKPDKIFVDVGGLGAGVVDRLNELLPKGIVVAVNAGSTPLNARAYMNKRAEMWGLLREWLDDNQAVQIPDSDELHADLCNIRYKIDSNSRLVMEQKADMKKRGIRSSDCADSLCLTFAQPATALNDTNTSNNLAGKIMQTNKLILNSRGVLYGNPSGF